MMRTRILSLVTGMALLGVSLPAAASGAPPVVPVEKPPVPRLEIYMPGDDMLDCAGIGQEIAHMEDTIISSDEIQQSAENTGTGISIAKAIGGFLIGSIPGAIGVMAAGHVAGEAAENQAEDAEQRENVAAQRRSMMIGMYNAKGCKGPIHSTRAVRNAAIDGGWSDKSHPQQAGYGTPQDVRRFDPSAIEPAAGGRGYKIEAHKVNYND